MNGPTLTNLLAIQWAYETPHYVEWVYAVVGMAVLGGVWWLVSKLFSKPDRRYGYNEPKALFGELCQAHKLPHAQRRLLKQIARQHRLANPAQIFLCPELFRADALPAHWRSQSAKVADLAKRLFE